jgi:hypothetical protein
MAMRNARSTAFSLTLIAAIAIALAASPAGAQSPRSGQALAPPKPYKVVPVTLPQPSADSSFAAFRKQILDIATRKDRGALSRMVANSFFWIGEKGDKADRKRSGIDNLAEAAELDSEDDSGWDVLSQVTGDPTLELFPERKGVMCSPAGPTLDEKAAGQLAKATATRPDEWGYATKPGLDVRAAPRPDAAVVEKLAGIQLIRMMPDDAPGAETTFLRVVTPSGKLGFVHAEFVKTFPESQLCYLKDASGWKIAGLIGG